MACSTDLIRRMGQGLCLCPSLGLLMGMQALPILPLAFGSGIFCWRNHLGAAMNSAIGHDGAAQIGASGKANPCQASPL